MSFISFINAIFSFFHIMLACISDVFSILIGNNIIRLSLCIAILFFIIDYQFEIIGLLPRILGLTGEQEKEFETKNITQRRADYNQETGITTIYSHTRSNRRRVK